MNKRINTIIGTVLLTVAVTGTVSAQCCGGGRVFAPAAKKAPKAKVVLKAQTKCPVMAGNAINKNLYVDVKGKRIYVCCKGCIASVKKSPDKYLAKIKANGETAATVLCGKCGETKGSDVCCKKDAVRCKKCKAIKGAPGCCKLPAKGEDAVVCVKCGEIKGNAVCCKKKS
ncbi:MAG: hypothetical protein KAH23_05565 [Kiritimatiellae bacterium]|nr:hypothetical protein [Kiritimatiellia bacterium]